MKFLSFIALITFSNLSFSNTYPAKTDVVQALEDSLRIKELTCSQSTINNTYSSSSLHLVELNGSMPEYNMSISGGRNQTITFIGYYGDEEYITIFTTKANSTEVTSINQYINLLSKTQVNIGSIAKPNFVNKIVRNNTLTISCK